MQKHPYLCFFVYCMLVGPLWHCQSTADYEKGSVEHIQAVTGKVDDAVLKTANQHQGDWLMYGRNYQEDRYSELDQINKETVKNLGLVWALEVGTKRGIEATPLVVDGIMFATGPWSIVYAIDVREGQNDLGI